MTKGRRPYLKKYKINEDDYIRMLIDQYFKCKICEQKQIFCGKLQVDHCHKTGKIRGLLCLRCNQALGIFEVRGKIVRGYLKEHFTDYLESKIELVSKYEKAAKSVLLYTKSVRPGV